MTLKPKVKYFFFHARYQEVCIFKMSPYRPFTPLDNVAKSKCCFSRSKPKGSLWSVVPMHTLFSWEICFPTVVTILTDSFLRQFLWKFYMCKLHSAMTQHESTTLKPKVKYHFFFFVLEVRLLTNQKGHYNLLFLLCTLFLAGRFAFPRLSPYWPFTSFENIVFAMTWHKSLT